MVLVHVQSAADAVDQKAVLDARLDKAQADAAEMKAAYDKVVWIAAMPCADAHPWCQCLEQPQHHHHNDVLYAVCGGPRRVQGSL